MANSKAVKLFGYFILVILSSGYTASVASTKSVLNGSYLQHDFKVELLTESSNVPWGMTFVSSHEVFITQRDGQAILLNMNSGQTQDIHGLPEVLAEGQGGLLDVATNPFSSQAQWLYFTYSKPTPAGGVTTLAKARLMNSRLQNWEDLLVTDSATSTSRHYGSRITFDDKGHVFFTVGDRGERDNAQNPANHAGTVIRLNLNGTTPLDNPFVDQSNRRKEIWSFGHRNPQGIAFDQANQRLWVIEHGPRGGDELNLIMKGKNYGWPVISYGKEYWAPIAVGESTHKEGMEQPMKYYVPSIAPGSLLFYNGRAFPNWQNHLFIGALKLTHLNVLMLDQEGNVKNETRLLKTLNERIRSLTESPEGHILFGTDSGNVFIIKPL